MMRCGYQMVIIPVPATGQARAFEAPAGYRLHSMVALPKSALITEPQLMLCTFEVVLDVGE